MSRHLIIFLFSFFPFLLTYNAAAQTCSVNAGVPFTLCVSADSFMLTGNSTGALATTATWSVTCLQVFIS